MSIEDEITPRIGCLCRELGQIRKEMEYERFAYTARTGFTPEGKSVVVKARGGAEGEPRKA